MTSFPETASSRHGRSSPERGSGFFVDTNQRKVLGSFNDDQKLQTHLKQVNDRWRGPTCLSTYLNKDFSASVPHVSFVLGGLTPSKTKVFYNLKKPGAFGFQVEPTTYRLDEAGFCESRKGLEMDLERLKFEFNLRVIQSDLLIP